MIKRIITRLRIGYNASKLLIFVVAGFIVGVLATLFSHREPTKAEEKINEVRKKIRGSIKSDAQWLDDNQPLKRI